jgi:hypothetical protein
MVIYIKFYFTNIIITNIKKLNSVAWVRMQTIPTERS